MSNLVFPTPAAIANVIPSNGNTVPIYGTQGISNTTELFMYGALSLENILAGDELNFGRGSIPTIQIRSAISTSGDLYAEVLAYCKLRRDYAGFPEGKRLWKLYEERLPNNAASAVFNL
jgi:hypothetical protein